MEHITEMDLLRYAKLDFELRNLFSFVFRLRGVNVSWVKFALGSLKLDLEMF